MSNHDPDLVRLAVDLAERHEPIHTVDLRFLDLTLRLRTNDASLADELRRYFRGFEGEGVKPDMEILALEAPVPPLPDGFLARPLEPGKTRLKEEYLDLPTGRVIRKVLTGVHFFVGEALHLAVGPCRANPNQVINFINNRFIQTRLERGDLLAHAAAVTVGGRGMAVAGFSGMGKSTLALHLLDDDVDYVSNDRLLLRRTGNGPAMEGVPKLPRVNPGTILNNHRLSGLIPAEERRRLTALPPAELWELEDKYDVPIQDLFGPGRFRLGSDLAGFVVLNWRRDGSALRFAEVDPAGRRDLLGAIMKDPGLFYHQRPGGTPLRPGEEAYLETLAGCRVFEAAGGVDFHALAGECLAFLRG